MIQIGQTHRHVDRVMLRQDRNAAAQPDVLRSGEHVGNENIVGRNRFPCQRVMLPNPGLAEPQFVRPHHKFDILFEAQRAILFRRM